MAPKDLALVDPAPEILRLHEAIGDAYKTSLEKAIRIGELLAGQKATLKHGQFLPWVEANLPFSERTTRNYMKVHTRRAELKSANVADLTAAYRLLSPPKPKPNLPTEPPVIEAVGETVTPQDLQAIDTSDPVFEEAEPESERLSIREVVARSGTKPINWTSPEGEDPREKFKALGKETFGVAPITEMTREEAEAKRPGYEFPEESPEDEFPGSRETHEGHEDYVMQGEYKNPNEPDPDAEPLQYERDALPDEAVELATEIIEKSDEATLVKFLKAFLAKRFGKD